MSGASRRAALAPAFRQRADGCARGGPPTCAALLARARGRGRRVRGRGQS